MAVSNQYLSKQYETSIPDDFICPVNFEVMRDPHQLACSHSFEKQVIDDVRLNRCPTCRTPIDRSKITRNIALRNAIEEFPQKALKPLHEVTTQLRAVRQEREVERGELNGYRGGLSPELQETLTQNDTLRGDNIELRGRIAVVQEDRDILAREVHGEKKMSSLEKNKREAAERRMFVAARVTEEVRQERDEALELAAQAQEREQEAVQQRDRAFEESAQAQEREREVIQESHHRDDVSIMRDIGNFSLNPLRAADDPLLGFWKTTGSLAATAIASAAFPPALAITLPMYFSNAAGTAIGIACRVGGKELPNPDDGDIFSER